MLEEYLYERNRCPYCGSVENTFVSEKLDKVKCDICSLEFILESYDEYLERINYEKSN